jgi:hypothetical protein
MIKFRNLLAGASIGAVVAFGATAAFAQSADIVFIVDESGSMSGEQAFLEDIISDLDAGLATAGITTRNYGVVGYGGGVGVGPAPRDVVSDFTSGSSTELTDQTTAEGALGSLTLGGGFEDGWEAIDFALNYNFTGDAINFILATDEDRDNNDAALTEGGVLSALNSNGVTLNTINDLDLEDGSGATALGIDSSGEAYLADGSGGFTTSTGGTATSGFVNTIDDYVDLALATGGAAWDLNQLRSGGSVAESFSEAFLDIKVREIRDDVDRDVPAPATLVLLLAALATLGGVSKLKRVS